MPTGPAGTSGAACVCMSSSMAFHCSIVGTCLTPGTARQIIRRAKLTFERTPRTTGLHSVLVSEAARPGSCRA